MSGLLPFVLTCQLVEDFKTLCSPISQGGLLLLQTFVHPLQDLNFLFCLKEQWLILNQVIACGDPPVSDPDSLHQPQTSLPQPQPQQHLKQQPLTLTLGHPEPASNRAPRFFPPQIGRASCRERVSSPV